MDIYVLWISVFNYPGFCGYPFGYSWISMGIHALTCYGFSIQGSEREVNGGTQKVENATSKTKK